MVRDGHSSGTAFADGLEQPTRTAGLTSPCSVIACANSLRCRPYSVLLPVGFAMPSPLPETRCALTAPFHPYRRCLAAAQAVSVSVALSLRIGSACAGPSPAGRYPAPFIRGARTFLPAALSGLGGAAVRPTDATGNGVSDALRQAAIRPLPVS